MKLRTEQAGRTFFRNGRDTNYFYAVKPVDFTLQDGSLSVITGRSGSGKTTLLHLLSGLLKPSEGRVWLDDNDLYALHDRERSRLRSEQFGIIPQGETGLPSLTVLENVLLPVAMYGKEQDKREQALQLLEEVGIGMLSDVYSNELSGGELRRMSVVRALVNDPSIIIADEPTGDLDEETTVSVMTLLKRRAEQGASVLIVTHDKDVLAYADRLYNMDKGVLTAQ